MFSLGNNLRNAKNILSSYRSRVCIIMTEKAMFRSASAFFSATKSPASASVKPLRSYISSTALSGVTRSFTKSRSPRSSRGSSSTGFSSLAGSSASSSLTCSSSLTGSSALSGSFADSCLRDSCLIRSGFSFSVGSIICVALTPRASRYSAS